MISKLKEKHSTKMAAILSVVLVVAMIMTGTLAWQSISQQVTNEQVQDTVVGGRLHDDFDGTDKDIYAENYTTKAENGEPLYVRVRLLEYMEIGEDAGINTDETDRNVETVIPSDADINDPETWAVHKPNGTDPTSCTTTTPSFHKYWSWELGGDTVYMPTFNKNNESLEVDVNGTWESVGADGKHYSDHVDYTTDVTANAQYSVNSSVEGTPATGSDGKSCIEVEETHSPTKTQTATVLTMQEWLDKGAVPGKFWVWDTDGWAYWAEALQPEEATGCLLTGIQQSIYVTGNMHYEIHVDGEFATAFAWGNEGDGENGSGGDGFYEKGVTDDGRFLLDRIASIVEDAEGNRYVSCGNNIYKRIYDNGSLGNAICAGEDLKIGTNDDRTDVIELEEDLVVDGVNYGNVFLGPGSNKTYWAMGVDNLLGTEDDVKIWYLGEDEFPGDPIDPDNFSFKGADELVLEGLTDEMEAEAGQNIADITTTVKLNGSAIDNQKVIWTIKGKTSENTKFENGTLVIGEDEAAGELTITVKSEEDKNANVTLKVKVLGPDEVKITKGGVEVEDTDTLEIEPSQTMNFAAEVLREGNTYSNNQVKWTIAGQKEKGTTVTDGTLKVDAAEMGNTTLTITASSVNDSMVKKVVKVKVLSPVSVSITSGGTEVTTQQSISQGNSKTFVATVKRENGTTYANNQVKWSLSGETKSGTSLVNGKLTVASNEPGNTILTITATSVNDTTVKNVITVKVTEPSKFDGVSPGSTTTVTIDGMEWYVLAKNGDQTLIWAKNGINSNATYQFSTSSNVWNTSCNAYSQLNTWLNSTSTLKNKAVDTTIYTRATYNVYTSYNEMTCKVFLLSEADVFGTANGSASNITSSNKQKEYTYNGAQLVTDSTIRKGGGTYSWLRSPRGSASCVASVFSNGSSNYSPYGSEDTLRPALWVKGL